jgi:hypothetical protein
MRKIFTEQECKNKLNEVIRNLPHIKEYIRDNHSAWISLINDPGNNSLYPIIHFGIDGEPIPYTPMPDEYHNGLDGFYKHRDHVYLRVNVQYWISDRAWSINEYY